MMYESLRVCFYIPSVRKSLKVSFSNDNCRWRLFPSVIHSALTDCRDGMITRYKGFSSSDTQIEPFGASRII